MPIHNGGPVGWRVLGARGMEARTLDILFWTVAEAVGSSAGLLAVFVLLRLRNWDRHLVAAAAVLDAHVPDGRAVAAYYDCCAAGDRAGAAVAWRHVAGAAARAGLGPAAAAQVNRAGAILSGLLPRRRALVPRCRRVLYLAGAVVFVAVGGLPVVPYLAAHPWSAWPAAGAVVAGFAGCGWLAVRFAADAVTLARPWWRADEGAAAGAGRTDGAAGLPGRR